MKNTFKYLLFFLVSTALLYLYSKSNTYNSYATIAIETQSPNFQNILDTQIEIIKSKTILSQALQKINFPYYSIALSKKKSISIIQKRVSVKRVGEFSTVIKISISDNVTSQAKDIVNAIVDIYTLQYNKKQNLINSYSLDVINQELNRVLTAIDTTSNSLEEFILDNDYRGLSNNKSILIEMKNRLFKVNIELELINRVSKALRISKKIDGLLLGGIYSNQNIGGKILEDTIIDLQKLIIKVKSLRADYTNEYPEVIKINRQILHLKNTLIVIVKNIYKSYKQEKISLESYIKKQENSLAKEPRDGIIYETLTNKLKSNRVLYNYLLEKQISATIERSKMVSKVYIIDRAY